LSLGTYSGLNTKGGGCSLPGRKSVLLSESIGIREQPTRIIIKEERKKNIFFYHRCLPRKIGSRDRQYRKHGAGVDHGRGNRGEGSVGKVGIFIAGELKELGFIQMSYVQWEFMARGEGTRYRADMKGSEPLVAPLEPLGEGHPD